MDAPERRRRARGGQAPAPPAENPNVHHEGRDVPTRAILKFFAFLVAAMLVVNVVVSIVQVGPGGIIRNIRNAPIPRLWTPLSSPPDDPVLESIPGAHLEDLRAAEDSILNGWGWVDRSRGLIRMPIEAAMERIASEGATAPPLQPPREVPIAGRGGRTSTDPSSGRNIEEIRR